MFIFLLLVFGLKPIASEYPPTSARQSRIYQVEVLQAAAQMLATTVPERMHSELHLEFEDTAEQEFRAEAAFDLGSRRRARFLNQRNQLLASETSLKQMVLELQALAGLRLLWVEVFVLQLEIKELTELQTYLSDIVSIAGRQAAKGFASPLDARRLKVRENLLGAKLAALRHSESEAGLAYAKAVGKPIPEGLVLKLPQTMKLGVWGKPVPVQEHHLLGLRLAGLRQKVEHNLSILEHGWGAELGLGILRQRGESPDPVISVGLSWPNASAKRQAEESLRLQEAALDLETQSLMDTQLFSIPKLQAMYETSLTRDHTEVTRAEAEARQVVLDVKTAWMNGQVTLTDWLDTLGLWEETISAKASHCARTLKLEIELVLKKGSL